jgi:RNA polymerase sigma-70 factor, ECF subfamily
MGELEVDLTLAPFAGLQGLFGFIPNLFRAQILLPRVVEAEAGIARSLLLEERALSRKQKLFILLGVAAAYRNAYCVTAYHRMLHSSGVAERQLDQIIIGSRQADLSVSDTALVDFALKLATNAPWLSGRDIAALRGHAFVDQAILEAILVTALSNFFCTLSIGLSPAADFEPRAISGSGNSLQPDERSYVGGISGPYLRSLELSPGSFPPFAFFLERFGFIPNMFRAQALRPDVIEAEAELVRKVLEPEDLLSHFQKECILLVASAANLNTYCVAVHCEMLRAMRVSMEESDQIAMDHHQTELTEANKALLDFVRKLAVQPSGFCCEDVDKLRMHDFTEEHILEAIAVTALNNFFNTLQMGLGTTPDIEPKRVFGPIDAHPLGSVERLTRVAQVDPDTGLVARVQNGELDAFEELVARHSRRVYRTLVGIIGNVEQAQDAMQDTFLKAFEHIGDFRGRSKFSTWLISIASNTALQLLRERKHLECLDDAGEEAEFRPRQVRAWDADPEQLYSQAERRRLVESGLMKLPSKYRVVLVLRDLEQLSAEEAATALGLRIPAIKARLFRARMMLREALSPTSR